MTVHTGQRYSTQFPCPVCGGHQQSPRHQNQRCYGFLSEDRQWAHCTRREHAGLLEKNLSSNTYGHKLSGDCRCGKSHSYAPPSQASHRTNGTSADNRRIIVDTYDYLDINGKLQYQVVRTEPKGFFQRRPDGNGGWISNLDGVERVLYRLPELLATDLGQPVLVPEGEKDVDRLRELGFIATCNPMGAGKWRDEYSETFRGLNVVIIPDSDPEGENHAVNIANSLNGIAAEIRILHLPDLPPKGDVSDYLGAGNTVADLKELIENSPAWYPGDEDNSQEEAWPEPGELPQLPVPPSLPAELIPSPLRTWTVDIAERASIPLEFVVCPALVGLSAVVGRSVAIQPSQFDDWVVVPNLWGGVVGRPGVMKTHAVNEALKPLNRLAAEARDRFQAEENAKSTLRDSLEAQITAVKSEMVKAAKSQKGMDDLQQNLAILKEALRKAVVVERRYITQDATVEKLGELLKENPRGLLVSRDELAGWLRTLDNHGREGEREFFLESWNGTGSYTFDRIGRGTIHIPAVTVSLVGGIQPGKLRVYIDEATSEGSGADGLLQRLQLMVWPDGVGPWEKSDRWPNREAKNRVFEIFKALDNLQLVTDGSDIPLLRFSPDAQTLFDDCRNELENRLRTDELADTPAFESHLSKYRSLMPSLALLFHLVDVVDPSGTFGTKVLDRSGPIPTDKFPPVALDAARLAAAWCEFLEAHARKGLCLRGSPRLGYGP